jgi:hypothetical protein
MGRRRGSIGGGYVRKTVSLPGDLDAQCEEYLTANPGVTLSAITTVALQNFLAETSKTKKKNR